ncbi:C-C motif chemokine 19a.1 [Siniperca chuatsi]|uniref:C-C motif chemokine 19a.1 n=1 Tax=Siniperca chuatsi TaxID=119488 RepID=UPI001CE0DFA9|nr:C-C motif chemokine 19a.1 [Siniperca chuatsi]
MHSPAQRPGMAPWGDAKLFFCILFIIYCCTATLAQIPMDCCLTVKNKTIEKTVLADYHQQIKGQGCSLSAMILVTRRGRRLCVPDNEPWIQEVVKHVDILKKYCKNHSYKGNRCFGVKRA